MISNDILRSRASVQAVQIVEGLRFASLQEAISELRASTLPGDVVEHFVTLLQERADAALKSGADQLASEALALGRHDEMTVFAEDIEEAVYTSLLDDNTCDPCAEADGTVVRFGSPEYERLKPPYRECDGGGRCRCQFVLTLKTEAPGGPVPLEPLSPLPPFEPLPPRGEFPPPLPTPPTPRVEPPVAAPPIPRVVAPPAAPPVVVPPAAPVPPAMPEFKPPPLAPKGAPLDTELEALRQRLAYRDDYAVKNPVARNDDSGFAKAYELADGRKVILVKETDAPLPIASLQELGFDVRRVKDVIAIIPNRLSGSGFYYGETKALANALYKRRRFSSIGEDLYRMAGYSEEHIAELKRLSALEAKTAPPRVPKVETPLEPIEGTRGPFAPPLRNAQEAFGFDAQAPAPAMPVFAKPEEASTWLRKTFPRMYSTPMTVRDMRAVNAAIGEFNRLAAVFPSVKTEISAFGTKALGGVQRAKFKTGEWAHVGRFGDGAQVVGLAPGRFADPAQLVKDLVTSEKSGFHPPGMNTPASIMTHEFGHALSNRLTSLRGLVVRVETDAAGNVTKRVTVQDIVDRYRPYITGSPSVRAAISGYATKNEAEAFAEAFASLSWTPEAQLSQAAANLRLMLEELRPVLQ